MESFTISQLVAFLRASSRQSDFEEVEAILTTREADLKKQQSEDLEELKALWSVLESKFTDEIANLETYCNSLQSDLEASRKEALEKSESFPNLMEKLRKRIANDDMTARHLRKDIEVAGIWTAVLEKERKEKSEKYNACLRNLGEVYEKRMAAETAPLLAQRDFLERQLETSRYRCASLELESKRYEEKLANKQCAEWMKRCDELEMLSLLEEVGEWNSAEPGSDGKDLAAVQHSDQKGKSAAGVITNSEGSAGAYNMWSG